MYFIGERWADVADQAPTVYAVWGGGATPAQALYVVGLILPPKGSGMTIRIRYRILNARLAAGAVSGGGVDQAGSVPVL
jgi:hypothetical protein